MTTYRNIFDSSMRRLKYLLLRRITAGSAVQGSINEYKTTVKRRTKICMSDDNNVYSIAMRLVDDF